MIRETFEKYQGIFRMIPAFVPRTFSRPGKRLRLHPDDYYALGTARGAIKERWFSSVVAARNGELTAADEGMSYVSFGSDPAQRFLFKDAVEELGAEIIGEELYSKYGTWPMYSKFFDYVDPLFHHLHPDNQAAARVGRLGKPEAYYFPLQYNNYGGSFPHTYFGFDPDTTKEDVKKRLEMFESGDNRITEISRAHRIELGTGWYTPAGVVHAPGSYLTYEPQWNSDVNAVFENITSGEINARESLVENCPDCEKDNLDYVMSLLEWDKNVDPHYKKHYFRPPIIDVENEQYTEKWITYATPYFSAKELIINPGQTVKITDKAAYGCIIMQGHGRFGSYSAEAACMLRYGQLSSDEYFVSEAAARNGVVITNQSEFEPIVMLKHFGPNNPDAPFPKHMRV